MSLCANESLRGSSRRCERWAIKGREFFLSLAAGKQLALHHDLKWQQPRKDPRCSV